VDPPDDFKRELLLRLSRELRALGISLQTCCEKEVVDSLPPGSGVVSGACIPGSRLEVLFGGRLAPGRDPGQRQKSGCGCSPSVDLGSYRRHPCGHGCLYCYARPSGDG